MCVRVAKYVLLRVRACMCVVYASNPLYWERENELMREEEKVYCERGMYDNVTENREVRRAMTSISVNSVGPKRATRFLRKSCTVVISENGR